MSHTKKIFSIEGNIGAGKTTLMMQLEKLMPDAVYLYEPVSQWKNKGGDDLLKAFYEAPKRWCYTFELESMVSKVRRLSEALKSPQEVIVMERSLYSDLAFQQVGYLDGKLTSMEMKLLSEWRDDFLKGYPRFDAVFYLDTSVDKCLFRIKNRGRPEENGISAEYLTKLEDAFMTTKYDCPIIYVDGDDDITPAPPAAKSQLTKPPSPIPKKILKYINKYKFLI